MGAVLRPSKNYISGKSESGVAEGHIGSWSLETEEVQRTWEENKEGKSESE